MSTILMSWRKPKTLKQGMLFQHLELSDQNFTTESWLHVIAHRKKSKTKFQNLSYASKSRIKMDKHTN